ncbi:hypothetical protein [Gloeocapsopsis dulcis]|nr:hypothetical protein [Gloeocapsopsis dulcis]
MPTRTTHLLVLTAPLPLAEHPAATCGIKVVIKKNAKIVMLTT